MSVLQAPEDFLAKKRGFGFFDEFDHLNAAPVLEQNYLLANGAAGADLGEAIIWTAPQAVEIVDIQITGDGSPTGVDDSNTSVWTVKNGHGGSTVVTETFNTANVFPADATTYRLGAGAELANTALAEGAEITLTVTNGATADLPAVLVTIRYRVLGASRWKVIAPNFGSATILDAAGGIVSLVPGAADNNEIYLCTSAEIFKFLSGKSIRKGWLLQFTEANTDDANVIAGLLDAFAVNTLQDNGAGPKSSFSGVVFFKKDGGTNWWVGFSIGSTQNFVELTAQNSIPKTAITAGGSAYQWLEIEVKFVDSVRCDVCFYVNGALVYKMKDQIYTSATEMQAGVGIKNGGSNQETLKVDATYNYQTR